MCRGCWVSEGQSDLTGVSGTGKMGSPGHAILKEEAAEARSAATPTPTLPLDTTQKPHSESLAFQPCSEWCTTSLLAPSSDLPHCTFSPTRPDPALHVASHTRAQLLHQYPMPVPHVPEPGSLGHCTPIPHALIQSFRDPSSTHAWTPHAQSLCQDRCFKILCMPRSGISGPHTSPAPATGMGTSWTHWSYTPEEVCTWPCRPQAATMDN